MEKGMKNLGRTIDQLIKIEPVIGEKLLRIKDKWKRYPKRADYYWQELLNFLNTEPSIINHPDRPQMKDVIVSKSTRKRQRTCFESVTPSDKVVGIIPENIVDKIIRQDQQSIQYSKMRVEANMTRDLDLLGQVSRSELLLEIAVKKVWVELKDHFKLWNKLISHVIKTNNNGAYVLVELPSSQTSGPVPNIIRMDQNSMRNFFKSLGLDMPGEE